MRILGYIENKACKITVFQLDHKFAIKFEDNLYEQTYKLRMSEKINGMTEIQLLVDADMIHKVMNRFREMHQDLEDSKIRNIELKVFLKIHKSILVMMVCDYSRILSV